MSKLISLWIVCQTLSHVKPLDISYRILLTVFTDIRKQTHMDTTFPPTADHQRRQNHIKELPGISTLNPKKKKDREVDGTHTVHVFCLIQVYFSSGPHLRVYSAWKDLATTHTFIKYKCCMKYYSKMIQSSLAPLCVAD